MKVTINQPYVHLYCDLKVGDMFMYESGVYIKCEDSAISLHKIAGRMGTQGQPFMIKPDTLVVRIVEASFTVG